MNTEIVELIVKLVIVVATAVATRYVIPWAQTKIGSDKLDLICMYADVFVKGIEQKYKETGMGKIKLAEVTAMLSAKASEIGIALSEDDIRLIIETAVKEMKEANERSTDIH